jgi:uncharacterized protein with ACT and thioredoxin-like domain
MPKADEQIHRIMVGLKVSEEEAKAIYEADKAIDRGERMDFDLSPEKEKEAKKYGNAKTHTTKAKKPKEKVADEEKIGIIEDILAILNEEYPNSAKIVNKEREISLEIGENHYSITLTKHRNKKN